MYHESVWFQRHLTLRSLSGTVFSFVIIVSYYLRSPRATSTGLEFHRRRLRTACNTVVDILQRWWPIWRVTTSRKLDRWRGTVGATHVHRGKGGRYRCYRAPSAIVLSTRHCRVFYSGEWNFAMRTYIWYIIMTVIMAFQITCVTIVKSHVESLTLVIVA